MEAGQLGLELEPMWSATTVGRGLVYYARALVPARQEGFFFCLNLSTWEEHWTKESEKPSTGSGCASKQRNVIRAEVLETWFVH